MPTIKEIKLLAKDKNILIPKKIRKKSDMEVFMGIEHSQNYLHSKQLVATLLSKSNICNDDIIIEIGPGKGIITIELAKKQASYSNRV